MHHCRAAFTRVELAVVVIIIGILVQQQMWCASLIQINERSGNSIW